MLLPHSITEFNCTIEPPKLRRTKLSISLGYMDGELLRFCRWYEIVWGRGSTYLKAIPQENIVILIRHHNPKKDPNWLHIRQETELSLRWMKERTRAYKKSQPKKTKKKTQKPTKMDSHRTKPNYGQSYKKTSWPRTTTRQWTSPSPKPHQMTSLTL